MGALGRHGWPAFGIERVRGAGCGTGADDGERYEFIRWIDAPDATAGIDIAGIADMDAIDLPMTRVTGISLGDLAGPAR